MPVFWFVGGEVWIVDGDGIEGRMVVGGLMKVLEQLAKPAAGF